MPEATDDHVAIRRSEGAAAVIAAPEGNNAWLMRWNTRWDCYYLPGGHRRENESFRACVVRELGEELQFQEGRDYTLSDEARKHVEFDAVSRRANAPTQYVVELFDAKVQLAAVNRVIADQDVRWVTRADVSRGRCCDGRAVSPTMKRLIAFL